MKSKKIKNKNKRVWIGRERIEEGRQRTEKRVESGTNVFNCLSYDMG